MLLRRLLVTFKTAFVILVLKRTVKSFIIDPPLVAPDLAPAHICLFLVSCHTAVLLQTLPSFVSHNALLG